METRLISRADAPMLAALHADSFGAAAWNLAQIADSLALSTTQGWLALGIPAPSAAGNDPSHPEDGRRGGVVQHPMPLGFILCQFTSDEAEILTCCTSPAARRQGVGRALLKIALDSVRTQKTTRLFLEVAGDNIAAIGLYQQAGFKPIGKRSNYYQRNGHMVDAVILEKSLLS